MITEEVVIIHPDLREELLRAKDGLGIISRQHIGL